MREKMPDNPYYKKKDPGDADLHEDLQFEQIRDGQKKKG